MKIRVSVYRRFNRPCYEAQWRDPLTGKIRTRTTGEQTRKEALRVAHRLEVELESGTRAAGNATWAEVRDRYVAEVLAGQAVTSRQKMAATFRAVDDLISPRLARSIDTSQVSRFSAALREAGLAEATIRSHLTCLRAVLRWAARVRLIDEPPHFSMPRARGMKGRAPTREEFERIREAAAKVVPAGAVAGWQFLLDGLWWSGLRLGEALALHWTDDSAICVDLSGRRPMFRIQAAAEKGRKFRLLPMAPEFARQLAAVPAEERRGRVFRVEGSRGARPQLNCVSRIISAMGQAAGVKVAEQRGRVKYASAHDFRRAFGARWSQRVMPIVLQELMRHESIQTTMEFYVGRQAEAAADQIWQAFTDKSTDTPKQKPRQRRKPAP